MTRNQALRLLERLARLEAGDAAIGKRILEVRLDRGFSLKDFAELVGVTAEMMRRYEKGTSVISRQRLIKIAARLKCDPARLFDPPEAKMPPMMRQAVKKWELIGNQK